MLILLADFRKKLLWLWLSFTAIIMVFCLIQTLTDKLENIVGTTWLWAFINLLPALVLLLVAVLLNKNPSKVVLKTAFQLVFVATCAYLLFVLGTQWTIPFATMNRSIEEYLQQSYIWLVPFQLVLMAAFGILYFRKIPLFKPNEKILLEMVDIKMAYAKANNLTQRSHAFNMLVDDKMNELFTFLRSHLTSDANDVVVLQGQYNEWIRQRDLNLSTPQELQIALNKLTLASINYVEKL
jgi:glucan phosphoethanolaminetransferase (alkaline phosphatase superfamily)